MGAHFERVSASELEGRSEDMLLGKIFKFKPFEMAGNAFKTNMVWWNLYTFNNNKRRIKNTFLHKELCSFKRSAQILQATKKSWVQHVKADGNSRTRRLLK